MSVKNRRAREREARREAILDAAERMLDDVGYRHLRMEQVADAAELSKGTLYLYFDGKDALCAGIAERRMAAIVPELRAQVEAAPDGLCALAMMSRAFFAKVRETRQMLRFAIDWFQAPTLDDASDDFLRYRHRVSELLETMTRAIVRGQTDGSIRTDIDPFHKAVQSWSSSVGVYLFMLNAATMEKRMGRPFDAAMLELEHISALVYSLASSPERARAVLHTLTHRSGGPTPRRADDDR